MTRHLVIFAACFLLGAVATAAVRTARHQPYPELPAPAAAPAPAAVPTAIVTAATPINTICPICAMPVDAKIPTAIYQGKVIGLGCRACPPKFAANPDLYGPAALQNRVVEE